MFIFIFGIVIYYLYSTNFESIRLIMLIFGIAIYYLYSTKFGRKSIFSPRPERPKLEIPVTYNIG